MKNDFIKDFWEENAKKYSGSHWASWGDNYAIDLEISNISNYIKKGDLVLDVGCANGYSSFRQLAKDPKKVVGIDFAEKMIEAANNIKKEKKIDKVEFSVGDARDIKFDDGTFDVTYTTRVIINLPNWEDQKKAIDECLRVTKKGGTVVFSEAFYEPLVLLNSIRQLKQLPPLVEHDFNRYIKMDRLNEFLKEKKLKFEVIDFSSIYYLGSRFLRDLVTDVSKYEGYTNPINEIFYNIEKEFSGGGFGIQQAYVVHK